MLPAAFSKWRSLPPFLAAFLLVNPLFADPAVTATQRDSFPDPDGDNRAELGDVITYETIIANGGNMAAQNLRLVSPTPLNTSFDPSSVKSTPLARDDSYAATGNVSITVPNPGVLTNDFDLGPVIPTVVLGSGPTTAGGSVTLNAGGGFTYNPPAGHTGIDTFTYTIADEGGASLPAPATGSNISTVTITVADMIWFIDDSAGGGGDGTFSNPFNTITALNGPTPDAPGQTIFVFSGTYTGGITLANNQVLIGEGSTQDVGTVSGITLAPNSVTIPTGGSRPNISGGGGIDLASGNTIRGLDIGNSTGAGIAGANVGTLTIDEVGVNSTGGGIDIDGGTLAITFDSLSSTGSTARGINLSGVSGSFDVSGGTIGTSGARGVSIDGTGTLTLGVTLDAVSSSGSDHGISLNNTTGSFTIAGTGTRGTGGTIANTTSHGINLTNVSSFSLSDAFLNNGGNADEEHGVNAKNLTGICRFDNCFLQGFQEVIKLDNESGVLTELKVVDSELNHNNPQNTFAENGMLILGFGDAEITVHVDNTIFEDIRGDGIFAAAGQIRAGLATNSHINLTVHNSDFNGVYDGGANSEVRRGVRAGGNENGTCTFDISGVGGANNFNDQIGVSVTAKNDSNGLLHGRIDGNTFLHDDDPGIGTGAGKLVFADGNIGTVSGTTRVAVTDNDHSEIDGFLLQTLSQDGPGVILEMEVGGNIQADVSAGQAAEAWNADIQGGSTLCIDTSIAGGFGGNAFTGVGTFGPGDGIVLRNNAGVLRLENFAGSTDVEADTHFESQNPGTTSQMLFSNGGTVAGGNCQSHSLPPTPLP